MPTPPRPAGARPKEFCRQPRAPSLYVFEAAADRLNGIVEIAPYFGKPFGENIVKARVKGHVTGRRRILATTACVVV